MADQESDSEGAQPKIADTSKPIKNSISYSLPRLVTTFFSTIFTTHFRNLYIDTFNWRLESFNRLFYFYTFLLLIFHIGIGVAIHYSTNSNKDNESNLQTTKIIECVGVGVHTVAFLLLIILSLFGSNPNIKPSYKNSKESIHTLEDALPTITTCRLFVIYLFVSIYAIGLSLFDLSNRALPTYVYVDDSKTKDLKIMNGVNVSSYGLGMSLIYIIISPIKYYCNRTINDNTLYFMISILFVFGQIAVLTLFFEMSKKETNSAENRDHQQTHASGSTNPSVFDYLKLVAVSILHASAIFELYTLRPLVKYVSIFVVEETNSLKSSGLFLFSSSFIISTIVYSLCNYLLGYDSDLLEKIIALACIGCQYFIYLLLFPLSYFWNKGHWLQYVLLILFGAANGLFLINTNVMLDNAVKKFSKFKEHKWIIFGVFFSITDLSILLSSYMLNRFYDDETLVTHDFSCIRWTFVFGYSSTYKALSFFFQALNIIAAGFYFKDDLIEAVKKLIDTSNDAQTASSIGSKNVHAGPGSVPTLQSADGGASGQGSVQGHPGNGLSQKPQTMAEKTGRDKVSRDDQVARSESNPEGGSSGIGHTVRNSLPHVKTTPSPATSENSMSPAGSVQEKFTLQTIIDNALASEDTKKPASDRRKSVERALRTKSDTQENLIMFLQQAVKTHPLRKFIKLNKLFFEVADTLNSMKKDNELGYIFYNKLQTSQISIDDFMGAAFYIAMIDSSNFDGYIKNSQWNQTSLEGFSAALKKLLLLKKSQIQQIKDLYDLQVDPNSLFISVESFIKKFNGELYKKLNEKLNPRSSNPTQDELIKELMKKFDNNDELDEEIKNKLKEELDQDDIDYCKKLLEQVFKKPQSNQSGKAVAQPYLTTSQKLLDNLLAKHIQTRSFQDFVILNITLNEIEESIMNKLKTAQGFQQTLYKQLMTLSLDIEYFKKLAFEMAKKSKSDFEKYLQLLPSDASEASKEFVTGMKKILLLKPDDARILKNELTFSQENAITIVDGLYMFDHKLDQDAINRCKSIFQRVFAKYGQAVTMALSKGHETKKRNLLTDYLKKYTESYKISDFITFYTTLNQKTETIMDKWKVSHGLQKTIYDQLTILKLGIDDFKKLAFEMAKKSKSDFSKYIELLPHDVSEASNQFSKGFKKILSLQPGQAFELKNELRDLKSQYDIIFDGLYLFDEELNQDAIKLSKSIFEPVLINVSHFRSNKAQSAALSLEQYDKRQKISMFIRKQIAAHKLKEFVEFNREIVVKSTSTDNWNTLGLLASTFYKKHQKLTFSFHEFTNSAIEIAKEAASNFEKYLKHPDSKNAESLKQFSNGAKKLLLINTSNITKIKAEFTKLKANSRQLTSQVNSIANELNQKSSENLDAQDISKLNEILNLKYMRSRETDYTIAVNILSITGNISIYTQIDNI